MRPPLMRVAVEVAAIIACLRWQGSPDSAVAKVLVAKCISTSASTSHPVPTTVASAIVAGVATAAIVARSLLL